jgi:hypothetical protein
VVRINTIHTPQALAAFDDLSTECTIRTISPGLKLQWYAKPRGEHIHDFLDGAATIAGLTGSANVQGLPTTSCDIFVEGGPASTNLLHIEIVINYELLPLEDEAHVRRATAAWPSKPHIHTAISNYAAKAPHVKDMAEGAVAATAAHHLMGGAAEEAPMAELATGEAAEGTAVAAEVAEGGSLLGEIGEGLLTALAFL